MNNLVQKIGIWLLFLASLLVIMSILLVSSASEFLSPLYNLFLVPILLAAALLNLRSCIIIGLLATVASSITANGLHLPPFPCLLVHTNRPWCLLPGIGLSGIHHR